MEYNLLRIAQEAVSNSVKHSGATNDRSGARVRTPEALRLSVKDDGAGFEDERTWHGRAITA